jgi:hypothetical protein
MAKTEKKGVLPKIRKILKIDSLNETQKIVLTIALTLIIVVGLVFSAYSFESAFIDQEVEEQKQDDKKLVENTPTTEFSENEKIAYQKISLFEADFYPETWIKANFEESEIANPLISGPEADADEDGLSNKKEFILGSNPKNNQTFCSIKENECEKTDQEIYNEGKNPLNNLDLKLDYVFVIQNSFVNKENFETAYTNAYKEDFKVLEVINTYEDKNQVVEEKTGLIEVKTEENQKESTYFEQIKKLSQIYLDRETFGSFLYLYQSDSIEANKEKVKNLKLLKEELEAVLAPPSKINLHQYLILSIKNDIQILENRIYIKEPKVLDENADNDESLVAEEKASKKKENTNLFLENVFVRERIKSYSEIEN